MSDIDKTFGSIGLARQKAFILMASPFLLWFSSFLVLYTLLLWDLLESMIYTSPIVILLYPLFYFKGFLNQFYFLTDEEMDFLNDWNEFENSRLIEAWEKWRKENRGS